MAGQRMRLKLTGLRETQRALKKLPDEIEVLAVERALTEAAEPMRAMAEELAPRARDENSLQDNIVITTRLTTSGRASAPADRRDEATVYLGPDLEKPGAAPHAHLVEFGTGPRFHDETGKYVGQMPAQPFMRPAFDSKKAETVRRFGPLLWEIIKRNAVKLAPKLRGRR